MAFLPTIPQATDALSTSQGNILNNFTLLGSIAGNDNPSSASINPTSGFNWIYLPPQGAIPPTGSAFTSGNIALYSASNSTTGQNELYINKKNQATTVQIPATASTLSVTSAPAAGTGGWTYLPSGILLGFGAANANGNSTGFLFSSLIANFPGFTQVLSMFVMTQYANMKDGDAFARLGSFTSTTFNVYGSARTTVTDKSVGFLFLAIGYK